MGDTAKDLMTAGNMAKALGLADAKVKKAILALGIKPAAKKGVCSYYTKEHMAKVKAVVK